MKAEKAGNGWNAEREESARDLTGNLFIFLAEANFSLTSRFALEIQRERKIMKFIFAESQSRQFNARICRELSARREKWVTSLPKGDGVVTITDMRFNRVFLVQV